MLFSHQYPLKPLLCFRSGQGLFWSLALLRKTICPDEGPDLSLRQKSKEFARIQGKRKVYHVDVELDQLMTSFRLTLANLLVFLAKEILDHTPIEINTLIQSILFLSGRIEHLPDRRKIVINKNEKDPQFMNKLQKGLSKLNALKITYSSEVVYEFVLN